MSDERTLSPMLFFGVRVLDLSRLVTGPISSSMMAELGADVIKVENPSGGGDETRVFPPHVDGRSLYFEQINHSRRSIAIDLKDPAGQALALRMAERCDVVIQNFLPGVAERLGLGYEQVAAVNPRVVYCSASGFGSDGPFRERRAYDSVMQAISGLTGMTGEPDGPPAKAGLPASDVGTAMFGAFGIAAALFDRERTGRGQHVEVNMLDTVISMMALYTVEYLNTGKVPTRVGTKHRYRVPSGVFPCLGGTMLHITMGDTQFPGFARATGHPEWLEDERFAQATARVEHREHVEAVISEVLLERTAQEWYEILDEAGVPVGPVNTIKEVFDHPQVIHNEIVQRIGNEEDEGAVHLIRMPIRFGGGSGRISGRAPDLGQDTVEILEDLLGMQADEIEALQQRRVVR